MPQSRHAVVHESISSKEAGGTVLKGWIRVEGFTNVP
ncbi:hypothetical protein AERO9AM_10298 [Aeromicrobium sp. 9AM]|nr:hypothetical protein AERO9AM_10298 [Aeromicrobium sp. 9AM]